MNKLIPLSFLYELGDLKRCIFLLSKVILRSQTFILFSEIIILSSLEHLSSVTYQ